MKERMSAIMTLLALAVGVAVLLLCHDVQRYPERELGFSGPSFRHVSVMRDRVTGGSDLDAWVRLSPNEVGLVRQGNQVGVQGVLGSVTRWLPQSMNVAITGDEDRAEALPVYRYHVMKDGAEVQVFVRNWQPVQVADTRH